MKFLDLGRIPYGPALSLQAALVEVVRQHPMHPYIILCEHNPVYTAGKRYQKSFESSPEALDLRKRTGAECFAVNRGGQLTWHGPGQLTVYPIVNISQLGMRAYVERLEECMVKVAEAVGVKAEKMSQIGVQCMGAKFGFVGVAQSDEIAHHGFAMNVCNDLEWFKHIVPCGMSDLQVTSLSSISGQQLNMQEIKGLVKVHFQSIFNFIYLLFSYSGNVIIEYLVGQYRVMIVIGMTGDKFSEHSGVGFKRARRSIRNQLQIFTDRIIRYSHLIIQPSDNLQNTILAQDPVEVEPKLSINDRIHLFRPMHVLIDQGYGNANFKVFHAHHHLGI